MSSTFHTICYHKRVINSGKKQHFKMTSWQGMPVCPLFYQRANAATFLF